ncbi:MAG: hypothetical protein AUH81_14215 [Candidatus Rokubacteria bacterium 13_1_40CM_4_69_5]|nr:MAG: hypothetical protein AUH81_14215 [Candidatus Rokubacteria bacterium 13_1_40CM_4_69_5]OLE37014.1 MAG: hypothetical protein AUG00_09235 [Candidatus Rokubacteria bacterium 13_1_20CM_2_70_7]
MAQRPAWVTEALFPYAPRYADVGGAHVHYIDEGAGPALLLLHGNPTWSFLYRDNLPALIVWGDGDFAFRESERQRFERIFPRHRTVILPGAGHYIQEEASGEIVEAIRNWWDTEGER